MIFVVLFIVFFAYVTIICRYFLFNLVWINVDESDFSWALNCLHDVLLLFNLA